MARDDDPGRVPRALLPGPRKVEPASVTSEDGLPIASAPEQGSTRGPGSIVVRSTAAQGRRLVATAGSEPAKGRKRWRVAS